MAGYLGETVRAAYDGRNIGTARLSVVIEPQPMGTGGALLSASEHLDERFFLMNGDSLFDFDLANFAAQADDGELGWLALRHVADTHRAGTVELDGTKITAFRERGDGLLGAINAGIYLLNRAILNFASAPSSIERDLFPILAERSLLRGKIYDGFFIDIGVPADLEREQCEVPIARGH